MARIEPTENIEKHLLSLSDINDIGFGLPDAHDPSKKMSANDVKKDIAVLARILIRGYVGWPFHEKIIKRTVLNNMIKIYDNAHDMSAMEFFNSLKSVIQIIPDNHLRLIFNRVALTTFQTRKIKNVGKNMAPEKGFKAELLPNNIALIAFYGMYRDEKIGAQLLDFAAKKIPNSSALIIDLRGNGGGNSFYSDQLAYYLYGGEVRSAKKVWVRTTPEARQIIEHSRPNSDYPWKNVDVSTDPSLWLDEPEPNFHQAQGYNKPIYILIDGHTGSSSEMFCLRMLHHPHVKFVGDNSRGMEVFGNMAQCHLPFSKITASIGMNYRELELQNFELNGLTPNIICQDDVNAYNVAMSDFMKLQKMKNDGNIR